MQLLISGDHADMRFILNKTDLSHNATCAECKRIIEQNSLEIAAHRVIVATRCDWFRRALLSGMKESIERFVCLSCKLHYSSHTFNSSQTRNIKVEDIAQ